MRYANNLMTSNKRTVLIIDDDKQLLSVLSLKFEQTGYNVVGAKDGREGIEVALKNRPDIILLDLRMPNLDGQGFLKLLRKDSWGKKVPVIVLTNSDSGHTIYLNIKDSVQGYFVKAEVSLKEIEDAVHKHIGNEIT